jgi:hypothetical protein
MPAQYTYTYYYDLPSSTRRNTNEHIPVYTNQYKYNARSRSKSETRHNTARSTKYKEQKKSTKEKASNTSTTGKATSQDARKAGIPIGYNYSKWSPDEEPILLAGSVFDSYTLGKWIYDWTIFIYNPGHPITEMAGELWLLLIGLTEKVKRTQELLNKNRKHVHRELLDDFIESSCRLWKRMYIILEECEKSMYKVSGKKNKLGIPISLGIESGKAFVNTIFGRDEMLDKTELLMTGMRLWRLRFDSNCSDIV